MVDLTCQKCGWKSGEDWAQCSGSCPMPGSPFHDVDAMNFRQALTIVTNMASEQLTLRWRVLAEVGMVSVRKAIAIVRAKLEEPPAEEDMDDNIPF